MVEGRYGPLPLGRHAVHEGRGDDREALKGGALAGDVGHLVGPAGRLGRGEEGVVVEGLEERPQGIGRGERPPEEAAQPGIRLQHGEVVHALAAAGQE